LAAWVQLRDKGNHKQVAFSADSITRVAATDGGTAVYTGACHALVEESYEEVLLLIGAQPTTRDTRTARGDPRLAQGQLSGR
jgi:hypothetical protein